MTRIDKLTKMVAVFDQFHGSIEALDDPIAKKLVANWAEVRGTYVGPAEVPRSALAAGMEQGLRETPVLLGSMRPEARKAAIEALAAAIAAHYHEALVKDAAQLEKIKLRGSIRGKREFHLVRHHIDLIEAEPSRKQELLQLYELAERFEARGT